MRPSAFLPLLLVPAIVFAQMRVDAARAKMPAHEEILYLWSGKHVRRFAPGFETIAADFYWLRTVQYFGSQRAFSEQKDFRLLEPLIDITVSLDPQLEMAYRYGAIFLAEPWPMGKGDPKAGVALLQRGADAIPTSWRLRQDLGYYTFLYVNEPHKAAEILTKAAQMPGAPYWLENLAAAVLAKGGDRATSRQMWQRMYEQAEAGFVRDNALYNLQRIDALDAVDAWNALLKDVKAKTGRLPRTLSELAFTGLPLQDPVKTPFAYDPATGTVSIAQRSKLFRTQN